MGSKRAKADERALVALRKEIDSIDGEILRLLARRARLALNVGQVKKIQGRRVYDPAREVAVLQHVIAANRGPLSPVAIERIFREIVRQHRRLAESASPPA